MRREVEQLALLGPLPSEKEAAVEHLQQVEALLLSITKPVTAEEAVCLSGLFGPDSCFGLAWTVLHLIESTPGWPLTKCLNDTGNEWIALLRNRA